MASQAATAERAGGAVNQADSTSSLTRTDCERCGGLMVREYCEDLRDDTGQIGFDARRCIQCGNVLDAVIQRNRLHPEAAINRRRNKWAVTLSAPILNHGQNQVSGQSAAQPNQGASLRRSI